MPRQPQDQPDALNVIALQRPRQLERSSGRPRKLEMPPMPAEIFEEMTELERQHYDFFIQAYLQDYPNMSPSDRLCLAQAGLEYVSLLRVEALQMKTKQLITMARQHPGVQLRQWLDQMNCTRKARTSGTKQTQADPERDTLRDALRSLSS